MLVDPMTIEVSSKVAAVLTQDSSDLFDYEDVRPKIVKKGYRGMVPWGEDNELPKDIITYIRKSEVLSSNKFFNSLIGYGRGLSVNYPEGKSLDEVKQFFRRNNSIKYLLEQITDQKHFFFSVTVLILTNDGKKIARIKHKDAYHCRFEENDKDGRIKNVFYAVWEDNPKDEKIQAYPVLDEDDPFTDLMVRMGRENNPRTGRKDKMTKDRKFAIITRFPTPGHKYYPFPAYAAHFNSGWYDVATMIPIGKKAKMSNGMLLKYHVEIHKDYFPNLFDEEKITDPAKRKARKTKEIQNIRDFLAGIENAGKVWFSGFYIDPNGKEVSMVKITKIDKDKEGGDWIEDAEEAGNIQCYADGVHPSLIGAVPGKAKGSFSGTDKRELFTMKQSLEKPFRDLLLIPYEVTREFNGWDEGIEFDIPDMMLTTLDQGTDAQEVSQMQNMMNMIEQLNSRVEDIANNQKS